MLQTRRSRPWGILLGMALAGALHLLQLLMGYLLEPALAYAGLTQWLYLAPAAWLAGRLGYQQIRLGLLLGGGLTLLINALAWAVVWYLFFLPK